MIRKSYYDLWDYDSTVNNPESWKACLMVRGCDECAFADFVALMNCGQFGDTTKQHALFT